MKYKELIESCRRAIEENRCLGCTALEDENFIGNRNCEYGEIPKAEETIKQIFLNLRGEKRMNIVEPIREQEKIKEVHEYLEKRNYRDALMFDFGIYTRTKNIRYLKI